MKFICAGLNLAFIEISTIAVMEKVGDSFEKYISLPKILFDRKMASLGQSRDVKNVELNIKLE
jgi:hypothetical protein